MKLEEYLQESTDLPKSIRLSDYLETQKTVEHSIGEAFGKGALREATFGIVQNKEESEALAKERPFAYGAGRIVGGVASFVGVGAGLRAVGLGAQAFKAGQAALAMKGIGQYGPRFVPNMIMTGTTFGSHTAIVESVSQIQEGKLDIVELTGRVAKNTAIGGLLGGVSGVVNMYGAVTAATALGYTSAKMDGHDDADSMINGFTWGAFEALHMDRDGSIRKNLFSSLSSQLSRYAKTKSGLTEEQAKVVAESYLMKQADNAGGIDVVLKSKENSVGFLEKLNKNIYNETQKLKANKATSGETQEITFLGETIPSGVPTKVPMGEPVITKGESVPFGDMKAVGGVPVIGETPSQVDTSSPLVFKTPEEYVASKEQYLYHNSAQRHLEDISNNGLTKDVAGEYAHGNKDIPDSEKRLYFAEDKNRALAFGGLQNPRYPESKSLLLRVKKSALEGKTVNAGLSGGETWYFGKDISPDKLEVYKDGEWQPLAGRLANKTKSQLTQEWKDAQSSMSQEPINTPINDNAKLVSEINSSAENYTPPNELLKSAKDVFVSSTYPLTERAGNIDPRLADELRKFEHRDMVQKNIDSVPANNFTQKFDKLDSDTKKALGYHLFNSNTEGIDPIIEKMGLRKEYDSVLSMYEDLYSRGTSSGMEIGKIDRYWPRAVNDVEGLLNYYKKSTEWSAIQREIERVEKEVGIKMTESEKVDFINNELRGYLSNKKNAKTPSNIKERSVIEVTPETIVYYKDPIQSMHDYIIKMNSAIAVRNLLGQAKNTDDSIGKYVIKLIDEGVINRQQEEEVRKIITARVKTLGSSKVISAYKNINYLSLMGDVFSAMTQVGDLGMSLFNNGFYHSLVGAKQALSKDKISREDVGVHQISNEFNEGGALHKAVDNIFKKVGLDAVDAFGKETLMNGAISRIRADIEKGDKKTLAYIKRVFGKDTDNVIQDLLDGKKTSNVNMLAFLELSKYQPVSRSEMPEWYSGDARLLYALKSYTIKQLSVFRTEVFKEIKTNPKDAMKRLLVLASGLIALGMTVDTAKDFIMGRKIDISDIAMNNILKLVALNKWSVVNANKDGVGSVLVEAIAPPTRVIDDLYKDIKDTVAPPKKGAGKLRSTRNIPIVGKFYYNRFGRGKEINDREKKKK